MLTTKKQPPQVMLQQLIQGFQVTQAIYVAARLGIADLLKDGPRSSEDLAQDTKTHAPSLYRAQNPEAGALFDQCMTECIASAALSVATAYDFSVTGTLVDVGGGHGQMLASILQTHPDLHGVLFDLPDVVEGASSLLAGAGVSDRCEIVGGDVFIAVPAGYDTYLLSRVLHGWDDECALAILSRCHQAVKPRGHVLLVERVLPNGGTPEPLVLQSDLHMLEATGGKERTESEYRILLASAGFELTRIIPAVVPYNIIEAMRA